VASIAMIPRTEAGCNRERRYGCNQLGVIWHL
jgi:hypothetical protein